MRIESNGSSDAQQNREVKSSDQEEVNDFSQSVAAGAVFSAVLFSQEIVSASKSMVRVIKPAMAGASPLVRVGVAAAFAIPSVAALGVAGTFVSSVQPK